MTKVQGLDSTLHEVYVLGDDVSAVIRQNVYDALLDVAEQTQSTEHGPGVEIRIDAMVEPKEVQLRDDDMSDLAAQAHVDSNFGEIQDLDVGQLS